MKLASWLWASPVLASLNLLRRVYSIFVIPLSFHLLQNFSQSTNIFLTKSKNRIQFHSLSNVLYIINISFFRILVEYIFEKKTFWIEYKTSLLFDSFLSPKKSKNTISTILGHSEFSGRRNKAKNMVFPLDPGSSIFQPSRDDERCHRTLD